MPDTVEVAVRVPVAYWGHRDGDGGRPETASPPNEQDTVGALIEHDPCDGVAESIDRAAPDNVVDTDTLCVRGLGLPNSTMSVPQACHRCRGRWSRCSYQRPS